MRIDSPVERYKGYVILKDPLPIKACFRWEQALEECQIKNCPEAFAIIRKVLGKELEPEDGEKELQAHHLACFQKADTPRCRPPLRDTEMQLQMLPAIFECVGEWKLEGIPERPTLDNFPGSPMRDRSKLVSWLIDEIGKVYSAEDLKEQDPNV